MQKKKKVLLGVLAVVILLIVVLSLPPVWSRVSYRVSSAYSSVKYWLFPPEKSVFVPGAEDAGFVQTAVAATLQSYYNTPTPAQTTPATPAPSTPEPTAQPSPTPTALPPSAYLGGVIPEPQLWNNCGPATLSMNLSYYQWGKTQVDTAVFLKPNDRDKNVMPYEMVEYVNRYTSLQALMRMGGDLQTLKTLVINGFPVLVEKGFEPVNLKREGWMGHFNLVIGYDEAKEVFITQDSYLLTHDEYSSSLPGFEVTYEDMIDNWRAFNYVFIVVYPPDKQNDVLNALGMLADETSSYRAAYERALEEANSLPDIRDRFFAWYNAGTSMVYLEDYAGAAGAFDMAFSIYPSIPEASRPWRMLWYQTGPYFAYYYTGRYQDVINLATRTLNDMSEPVLEESYYWRGISYYALGDRENALSDFWRSDNVHPGFPPSLAMLQQLGALP